MNKVKLLLLALSMTATTASASVIFSVENTGQMTSTQAGVNTENFNDGILTDSYSVIHDDYTIYDSPSRYGSVSITFWR
jgi:hypothetical protein